MQFLRIILPRGKGSKFMKILKDYGATAIGCFCGEGSAPIEILNALAIDKTKKEIYEQMDLRSQGKGIIYSLPVNHVAGLVEQND